MWRSPGLPGDGERRGRRPRRPQHLPHPRARLGEDLFRTRQGARIKDGAARAQGATPRSSSPAASPRPRAARSCAASRRSTSSSGRRTTIACPSCCARPTRRGRRRHRIPARGQVRPPAGAPAPAAIARARRRPPSSPCRRAATSSARSASFPTRAAARSRGRSRKVLAEIARLAGAGVARDHADRPERQRLSRARRGRTARSISPQLLARPRRAARRRCGCAMRPPIPTT